MVPLITVGIPVYNGMPWLSETVESIRRQSFADFAVLVIDDGSTHGTGEYLRSLHDSRFRIIRHVNRGITYTLNRMLSETESPWLMRQDADDIALPQRLARTIEYIQRYPEAGLLYSHACHYQGNKILGRLLTTEGDPEDLRRLVLSGYLPAICHSTVVLNVAKARDLGGYRFDLNVEEYDMFWRMALSHGLRLIPEALVGYRMRDGSITAQNMRRQAAATLYVQYLLLSAVSDATPQLYEAVRQCLESIVDQKSLDYRLHMREALTALGARRYLAVLTGTVRGLVSSPGHFLRLVLYQLDKQKQVEPQRAVHVGEPPKKFFAHAEELWPGIEIPEQGLASTCNPLASLRFPMSSSVLKPRRDARE